MGAFRAFSASRWKNLTVEGNKFWATGILFDLATAPGGSGIADASLPKPDLASYHIDKNTYISYGKEEAFRYGGGIEATQPGELLNFAQWQKLGLDTHSMLLPGKDGLCHISELADFRVNKVEDVVKMGESITVKVVGIDERVRQVERAAPDRDVRVAQALDDDGAVALHSLCVEVHDA
jgi:hypothetical protein